MALRHDALDHASSRASVERLELVSGLVIGLRKHFVASRLEIQIANLSVNLMSSCMVQMMVRS